MGLFKGVTGVVAEPFEGTKNEGVAGFFKGISRGVTGLYVKPAGKIFKNLVFFYKS